MRTQLLIPVLTSLLFACGGSSASDETAPAAARSDALVEPAYLAGNPRCSDLGYAFELKIDGGPYNGVFNSSDGYLSVTVTSIDGVYVAWASNVGVDIVLVKGGDNANAYSYDEGTSDGGLSSPINPNNGTPYAISHVSFCYDYEVEVTKTASTSFTRSYDWSIAKLANQAALTLSPGQTFPVGYTVTASVAATTDSDFAVAGTITVTNPAPIAATLTGVVDVLEGVPFAVDCGATFPYELAPGASLTCTYGGALADAGTRLNTAEATATGPVGGNSGEALVDFASASIALVDECVAVSDSMVGALGTVCAGDAGVFQYTANVGPYVAPEGCGEQSAVNVATFVEIDSAAAGSASATVAVTVPCSFGCTLTQGYWKTHSAIGPAPYDDTWAQVGESAPFFDTGLSWHRVLWTPPAGNAYFVLAHQYAAAYLNGLNGADTSVVAGTMAAAASLLNQYDGNPQAMSAIKGAVRNTFVVKAATLDAYNNGLVGPGHCSE